MARRLATGYGDRDVAQRHEPERTCAVTREQHPVDELIRFVRDPDGVVVPDVANRLPGRGVWLKCDRAIVAKAARQGAFARSLKTPVVAGDDLPELVDTLIARRVVQSLALANKAGAVVACFTKVETVIAKGEAYILLHAAEAKRDGVAKLDGKMRAISEAMADPEKGAKEPKIIVDLTSAELSLALGRQNVVHAALRSGGAAKHFLTEARRLSRYRAHLHVEAERPPHRTSSTEQA
ncbi:MAG: RNA-binding protein [Hyphomicrobiaceae bacterium]